MKDHEIILYADDTSAIITAPNYSVLNMEANLFFYKINKWFQNNLLFLNLSKTLYTEFSPNFLITPMDSIQYDNTNLINAPLIKFLGLTIDRNLTWKQHVDIVLRRLSSACYAINCVKYTLPIDK